MNKYVFTKRHYDIIAGLIKISVTLQDFVEHYISFATYDNEEFDEDKFREACGKWISTDTSDEQLRFNFDDEHHNNK